MMMDCAQEIVPAANQLETIRRPAWLSSNAARPGLECPLEPLENRIVLVLTVCAVARSLSHY